MIIAALLIVASVVAGLCLHVYHLEQRIAYMEAAGPRGCSHPEVENVGTFGAPEYQCVICRQRVSA